MNLVPLRRWISLAIVLGAVGCSRTPDQPQAATTDYLAVALGQVDVEGGLLGLAAGSTGRITHLHVRDGQSVHRGQLLLSVDDKPTKSAIAAAVAAEAQAKAEMRALDGQWHTAAVHAQRLSAAATDGAGDRQSAEDGTASAANVAAQLEAAKANLRMAEVRTREARRQWHLTKLRSPTDGQIIAIAGREGTTVTPEMSVVTLLPASPLIVRAELETQQVETIAFGMPAIVTDEDTGATLTTASVDRVGVIAGASTLISDPQRRSAIRTVECILKLPATTHLRVGQRVVVRFPRQPVPAQH